VKDGIKREISVRRLAEARGIQLRHSGKELIGLLSLPQRHQSQPQRRSGKELWHCKGARGEGGDVLGWVMRTEGVSFNLAVEMLKRE
jgi:DNA primase